MANAQYGPTLDSTNNAQILCDVAVITHTITPQFDIAGNLFSVAGTYVSPVDFPAGNTVLSITNLGLVDPNDNQMWFTIDWGDGVFNTQVGAHDYAGVVDGTYNGNVVYSFASGYTYAISFVITIFGGTITALTILPLPVTSYPLTVGRAIQNYNADGTPDGGPLDASGAPYVPVGTLTLNCVESYNNPQNISQSNPPIQTPGTTSLTIHNRLWTNADGLFTISANTRSITITTISADALNTIDVTTIDGLTSIAVAGLTQTWAIDKESDLNVTAGAFTITANGTSQLFIHWSTY